MFSFWEEVDTWQNFVIGALTANKVSWTSSFGKKISICMRKTKINLKGDRAWNTQKNNSFSQAPLLFSQVGLIWNGAYLSILTHLQWAPSTGNISSQIQIVLIWGSYPYQAKSLWPNMGYPISGQTEYVPIKVSKGQRNLKQTVFFGIFIQFFCLSYLLLNSPQLHDGEI